MADSKGDFISLKDVDSSFQNRSNSIFDRLGSLEPSNENSGVETEDETAKNEQRNVTNARNNSPSGPSPRRASRRLPARVPQHVLSPEKWTKYSLENDGTDEFQGLNEHSLNKHAAHSFLADLKKRKLSVENSRENAANSLSWKRSKSESENQEIDTNKQTSNTSSKNIVVSSNIDNYDSNLLFKKPEPKIDMTSPKTSAGVWKDGTYTMPEYVVGSAQSKASPRPGKHSGVKTVSGNGPVKLEHLGEESGVATGVEEGKMGKVKGKRNFRKTKMDDKRKDDDNENNTD